MKSVRGAALILALLFLSFLTVLGGALLTTSTIDVWISDNYKTNTQCLYLAEAGIEQARELVRVSSRTPTQLLTSAAGPDDTLSTSTDLVTLLASDDQPLIPSDAALRVTGQPLIDSSGRIIGRYHVWLRNDNAESMAAPMDHNQVLTLLSFGVMRGTRKVIEVTIKKAKFPKLPAAVTFDGPASGFDYANSTLAGIDGNDAGAAREDENAVGVVDDNDVGRIVNALIGPPDLRATYSGVSGIHPDVANTEGEMEPALKRVSGLESLVSAITANASDVYSPPFGAVMAIGNYGMAANYRIAVVNGDVNLGPGFGYGILLARGDLRVTGSFTWNGLILIIGQGALHWNGAGDGSINGGLFLARTRANDRSSENPLGTLLSSRGEITADFNGARGSGIHYNTSLIEAANQALPYNPIAIRER